MSKGLVRKYIIWPSTSTLELRSQGTLSITLYIIWPMHLQSSKLLQRTV